MIFPSFLCVDADAQKLVLGAHAFNILTEAAGGLDAFTIWRARRAARRFGVRIRIMDRRGLQEALLREGQKSGQHGVIYIARDRNMARFRVKLLHELAEACLRWEGEPPCVCQVSRHEVACVSVATAFKKF